MTKETTPMDPTKINHPSTKAPNSVTVTSAAPLDGKHLRMTMNDLYAIPEVWRYHGMVVMVLNIDQEEPIPVDWQLKNPDNLTNTGWTIKYPGQIWQQEGEDRVIVSFHRGSVEDFQYVKGIPDGAVCVTMDTKELFIKHGNSVHPDGFLSKISDVVPVSTDEDMKKIKDEETGIRGKFYIVEESSDLWYLGFDGRWILVNCLAAVWEKLENHEERLKNIEQWIAQFPEYIMKVNFMDREEETDDETI